MTQPDPRERIGNAIRIELRGQLGLPPDAPDEIIQKYSRLSLRSLIDAACSVLSVLPAPPAPCGDDQEMARLVVAGWFLDEWTAQRPRPDAAGRDTLIAQVAAGLQKLRATIAAPPAEGWRSIESAPKDGTPVWVYVAPYLQGLDEHELPGFQCVCSYHSDAGWCADELRKVTHWRPLPSPPSPELEGET